MAETPSLDEALRRLSAKESHAATSPIEPALAAPSVHDTGGPHSPSPLDWLPTSPRTEVVEECVGPKLPLPRVTVGNNSSHSEEIPQPVALETEDVTQPDDRVLPAPLASDYGMEEAVCSNDKCMLWS